MTGPIHMNQPMQPEILANAPRCGARTRAGTPCRSPAVGGRARCRMHGGAKGSGAQRGNRNAWKHGACSAEFKAIARYVRASRHLVRAARSILWTRELARRIEAAAHSSDRHFVQTEPKMVIFGDPERSVLKST